LISISIQAIIANFYVSATRRGQKMFVAGTSSRVLQLFKLTRVDTVIPLTASVEEAEGLSGETQNASGAVAAVQKLKGKRFFRDHATSVST
jgi:hypothetical protein